MVKNFVAPLLRTYPQKTLSKENLIRLTYNMGGGEQANPYKYFH